jgi:hypothetical protein
MSLDELKDILGDNKVSYSSIKLTSLANISRFVNVRLQMDNKSLDYYYEMNVDELLKSDIPNDELEVMKEQGWSFSNDNKFLILYLKNN